MINGMWKSNLIKGFVMVGFLTLPGLASAKTLNFAEQTWELTPAKGTPALNLSIRNDVDLETIAKNAIFGFNTFTADNILDEQTASKLNEIASTINQPARDAKLVLDGKIAKEFEPGQDGQGLDIYLLRQLLFSNSEQITIPVIVSSPTNKLADTNNLGITELVAVGESDFKGSPRNRIHNVTVGANKFNNLLIDKGEEFSFNTYLGDVDGEHGFLPELVIKATGTVPEFGGGLCQVSSTAFRAAMNAGLPITARRNHSYAVQYYAPQGTDATIYPGVQDMKFINDTPGAILVRTKIDGTKLYFEFYGTKDNRTVAFDGPVQYDKKSNGALKATWTRHVTKDGDTVTQVFNSNYQPPALFHKQEQTSTPNPETTPTQNNQVINPPTT
jgi:vancomycin resistance protein YoaR